jgi:hypothetical protein
MFFYASAKASPVLGFVFYIFLVYYVYRLYCSIRLFTVKKNAMSAWIHRTHQKKKTVAFLVICVLFFASLLLFSTHVVQAQGDTFGVDAVEEGNIALPSTDIRVIAANIIRAVLGLLGLLTVILMMYGGYTIMTSGGSEEKVIQGKKILVNASIGLAIILSAFAIVQFIINAITGGGSGGFGDGTGAQPSIQTFSGSGSLGRIVEDHYPFRDQQDVPRNTKIVVTFAEPIDPTSLVVDTNGDDIFGGCVVVEGQAIVPETDCDQLITDAIEIYESSEVENPDKIFVGATVDVLYDGDGTARTFILRPIEPLGTSIEDIWYTVDLRPEITKANGETGAFDGQRSDHYVWEFRTGTSFDFTPPSVQSTYPKNGGVVPRNSIVQINFSEPVDPINVQGVLSADGVFSTIIFGDVNITGTWQITNGYRTVEFVSDAACGQNSCGDIMFCLPVDCPAGDNTCSTDHQALVRTAELEDPTSDTPFLSLPFTGVTDMAGNALDNGPEGIPDGIADVVPKPVSGLEKNIDENELAPDNYWWNFSVENKIDRSAPYVRSVAPGLDQQGVIGNAPLEIVFSKQMWHRSIREDVRLDEYPANVQGMDDIWFRAYVVEIQDGGTVSKAIVDHRSFGPNNLDLYYFPQIRGTIKGVNQNCLYPGRGPDSPAPNVGNSPTCVVEYDQFGTVIHTTNCVGVSIQAETDTGCIMTGGSDVQKTQPNIEACLGVLEENSPTDIE